MLHFALRASLLEELRIMYSVSTTYCPCFADSVLITVYVCLLLLCKTSLHSVMLVLQTCVNMVACHVYCGICDYSKFVTSHCTFYSYQYVHVYKAVLGHL